MATKKRSTKNDDAQTPALRREDQITFDIMPLKAWALSRYPGMTTPMLDDLIVEDNRVCDATKGGGSLTRWILPPGVVGFEFRTPDNDLSEYHGWYVGTIEAVEELRRIEAEIEREEEKCILLRDKFRSMLDPSLYDGDDDEAEADEADEADDDDDDDDEPTDFERDVATIFKDPELRPYLRAAARILASQADKVGKRRS